MEIKTLLNGISSLRFKKREDLTKFLEEMDFEITTDSDIVGVDGVLKLKGIFKEGNKRVIVSLDDFNDNLIVFE